MTNSTDDLPAVCSNGLVRMPNGCELTPGGRVRMSRKQIAEIPEAMIDKYGLELDDAAASHDSEGVMWPRHSNASREGRRGEDADNQK